MVVVSSSGSQFKRGERASRQTKVGLHILSLSVSVHSTYQQLHSGYHGLLHHVELTSAVMYYCIRSSLYSRQ